MYAFPNLRTTGVVPVQSPIGLRPSSRLSENCGDDNCPGFGNCDCASPPSDCNCQCPTDCSGISLASRSSVRRVLTECGGDCDCQCDGSACNCSVTLADE
jgi:hypothetical protein